MLSSDLFFTNSGTVLTMSPLMISHREVTQPTECTQPKKQREQTSGIEGVHFDPIKRKWAATLGTGHNRIGRFRTFEEGKAARAAAAKALHGLYYREG
jgi:hypothetical protein